MNKECAQVVGLLLLAVALAMGSNADAAVLQYEAGSDNATFTFPSLRGPVAGDLGESATVTAVGPGSPHNASGPVGVLVDGTGGNDGADPTQNFFYLNANSPGGSSIGKVLMSWDEARPIGAVRTFSWQQYSNDLRYPQYYKLYGSNAAAPGTADAALATPAWDLLAEVDSRGEFGFANNGSSQTHPRQTAVGIAGDSPLLGTYQHLLWRLETPGATQHTFMREFDVVGSEASIAYQAADPGTSAWFPAAAPAAGDLAESATVSLVEGSIHGSSGPMSNLTDGSGGDGGLGTSLFTNSRAKILFSWDSPQHIAELSSFSWQDYDQNDRRFPQIYEVYGSTLESPATDNASLASSDWALLATVDSTSIYPYDGNNTQTNPSPEQLAVRIMGEGNLGLGEFRHLLIYTNVAAGGLSTFWSEIDIRAVPEPSSWLLLAIAGLLLGIVRRR
jgi:hypothetical protein